MARHEGLVVPSNAERHAPTGATLERIGPTAGLVAWAVIAAPALSGEEIAAPVAWWTAYLTCGALFAVTSSQALAARPNLSRWLLVPQVAAGIAGLLAAPTYAFAAVPMIINMVSAAFLLPFRAVLGLVAAQTAVIIAVLVRSDHSDPTAFLVTLGLVYGGFQLFSVWAVELGLRESRARRELAVVNAQLAAAQARLAESSRTAERLRIARDLHDVIGHQLTALAVNLEVASHLAQPPAAEHVERSRTIAKDLLRDVRTVVGQVRDRSVDAVAALRMLASAVPHPAIHLSVDDDVTVDDPVQSEALLRCVQEIVTNTVRHADADNLWIDIARGASGTVVHARDDGQGTETVRPGNGLTGMRERLEQIGGELAYRSRAGEGFDVVARLP